MSLPQISSGACALVLATLLFPSPVMPQSSSANLSNETVQQLFDRLAAAEARIKQLENQLPGSVPQAGAESPVTASGQAQTHATPVETPPAEESHDHAMEIPGGPSLHFRGFMDFNFDKGPVSQQLEFPLNVPAKTSFRAGEFDLFITSQLADKLSFLSEMVFSTDSTNTFGIDIERFQLTYRPSRYFEVSGGRFHTAIGYYNTAFHHGNWFSTATGRPFMFYFEDAGGVLPVHEVGITTTGAIPGSGKLNLHWIAELGNGSAEFGSPLYGDGVQGFASDRNRKDVNFAVYSRPEWLDGLQIGGSFLTGELIPANGLPKVNQTVSSAYAVLSNSKWEFLNEIVLLHHHVTAGGRTYNSPMGYTQLAYRLGKYRPYFRFQESNIAETDPVSAFTGRYEGPSVGLRFDAFRYAALKLQYNRVYLRGSPAQNGIEAQTAFTF